MTSRHLPAISIAVAAVLVLSVAASWLIKHDFDTLIIPPDAILPDGSRYYGDVVDGRFHGQGRQLWSSGTRYEGEFADGLASGRGKLRFYNGDVYEGQFQNGAMTGQGTLRTHSGMLYEGSFANDAPTGLGILKLPDGKELQGEFLNWELHGEGTYTDPDAGTYSGNFINGQFSGLGSFRDLAGNTHEGQFENWQPQGPGKFTTVDGEIYSGHFENGILSGSGRYDHPDGHRYEGEFANWAYEGEGSFSFANGDRYSGEFQHGLFHGQGEFVYANPEDGVEKRSGEWRYGQFMDPDREKKQAVHQRAIERALYRQDALLKATSAALLPSTDEDIQLYFVGFAGDGRQDVFLKEVNTIRHIFDETLHTAGRSALLINHPETIEHTPMATHTSLRQTLLAVSEKMRPEKDILFLYLTSHGSEDHELAIANPGISLPSLAAHELAEILGELPIKWKIVTVSACFSGGFIPYLEDENTLIMTAASSTRKSFGCSDSSEMTYFGRALFKEELSKARSFQQAFYAATELIRQWEAEEIEDEGQHSLPQIHAGSQIVQQLALWRSQLPN